MTLALHKPALGKAATAFLGKKHRMLIDGKWTEARSGETFPVEDPATQETIGHVPSGDKADVDQAVAAARRAFDSGPWSRLSPADRSRMVWTLRDLLEKHADEFAQLEALDNGKPVKNARRDDIGGSIAMFRYMAGWATRLNGETIPVSTPGNWHAYTMREPVGVVGQIIPWNFPLMMAAWKLAPALAVRHRSQARRANAAIGTAVRRADRRSRNSRWRGQHRHRFRRDRGRRLGRAP